MIVIFVRCPEDALQRQINGRIPYLPTRTVTVAPILKLSSGYDTALISSYVSVAKEVVQRFLSNTNSFALL